MKELIQRSGLPRTTIHFYQREGLLPPPAKTASNAALYGLEHLERLQLLGRLRSAPLGPFPLSLIGRILELVDQGVDLEVAVALERAVLAEGPPVPSHGGFLGRNALARASGVPRKVIGRLVDAGLLVSVPSAPGGSERFDATDVHVVRIYHDLLLRTGLAPEAGRPIARLIGELSSFEFELANRVVKGLPPNQEAETRRRLQEGAHAIHQYLFLRIRLHDIANEPGLHRSAKKGP